MPLVRDYAQLTVHLKDRSKSRGSSRAKDRDKMRVQGRKGGLGQWLGGAGAGAVGRAMGKGMKRARQSMHQQRAVVVLLTPTDMPSSRPTNTSCIHPDDIRAFGCKRFNT